MRSRGDRQSINRFGANEDIAVAYVPLTKRRHPMEHRGLTSARHDQRSRIMRDRDTPTIIFMIR